MLNKKITSLILLATAFIVYILGFEYLVTKQIDLVDGCLFALFILLVTLFFKYYRIVYSLLIGLTFLEALFFTYFQRSITHTDIKLFFAHVQESFESFVSLSSLFILPFIFLLVGIIFLWITKQIKLQSLKGYGKQIYVLLVFLFLLNVNSSVFGFELLYASMATTSSFAGKQYKEDEIPRYPNREIDYNIVLLIGESMRYDAQVEKRLEQLGFFHKKIYAGATNTDVVVPLLLNGKNNPLYLSQKNETNLFRLAKKSGFETHFISMQTPNEGRYIKPYLQTDKLDYYKSYTDEEREIKYDALLLDALNKIDFTTKQFVVMQQIGQHSPYRYFEGEKSKSPAENYLKSLDVSFEIYVKMYELLLKMKKPFVFIYVSDHGEFVGEGGRYGHNCFNPMVYEVPMFITSNVALPKGYKALKSQYHLSSLLRYLLGYEKELKYSKEKTIINGTMMSREDGFIEVN